jgi:ribosomal protein S6--L-glutamate ligase
MRFAIITEGRYLVQRMPRQLLPPLLQAGHRVDIFCSDDEVFDFPSHLRSFARYHAVIARDRSIIGLFWLAWAEKAGVPAVNTRTVIEGVRNKAEMTATLAAAGVPMPPTVVCRRPDQLARLPASFFPLVLKPNFGDNGHEIQLVFANDIPRIKAVDHSVVLAQKFLPNDGFDIKLYVAGEKVWAVRKPNLLSPESDSAEVSLVTVNEEMRSLALRCGAALGLDVYGVDALPGHDGLKVLEVNEFPNFSGIDEAPRLVADLLIKKARQRGVEEGSGAEQRPPKRVA